MALSGTATAGSAVQRSAFAPDAALILARRLAAFVVDLAVLIAFGYLLDRLTGRQLILMGVAGHVWGAVAAGVYFTILEGSIGRGRSVGMLALGLRVISRSGEPPELGRAAIRYVAMVAPLIVCEATPDLRAFETPFRFAVSMTTGLAGIMLVAANGVVLIQQGGRRALHDVIARTLVVRASDSHPPLLEPLGSGVLVSLLAIPPVTLLATVLAHSIGYAATVDWAALDDARQFARQADEMLDAEVRDEPAHDGTAKTHIVSVICDVDTWPRSPRTTASAAAHRVMDAYPAAKTASQIRVGFRRGLDLGFVQRLETQWLSAPPAEWKDTPAATTVASLGPPLRPAVITPDASTYARSVPRSPLPEVDDAVRAQIAGAISASGPLRAMVVRYMAEHHAPPPRELLAQDPHLWSITSARARIALGTGGAVDMTLLGGPFDGHTFSWVPLGTGHVDRWICTHGDIPPQDFGPLCP